MKRKIIISIFVVFLISMYILTFIQRFFESNNVATVEISTIERKTLKYEIKGKGIVKGNKIIGQIDYSKDEIIQIGDEVEVFLGNQKQKVKIEELSYDTKEQRYNIKTECPKSNYEEGKQVKILYEGESISYICVKKEAVHKEKNGVYYVYLAKEKKGLWGNELVSQKKYISVVDEDNNYLAINENSLDNSDKIIVYSNMKIYNQSKVKLLE